MNFRRLIGNESLRATCAGLILTATAIPLAAQQSPPSVITPSAGEQVMLTDRSGLVSFAGKTLTLTNFTGILGLSTAAGYVVVIDGSASDGTVAAERGRMLLIPPYGAESTRERYDAGRLLAGLDERQRSAEPVLHTRLSTLAATQKRGIFFGRLARTRFNVGAPGSAEDERAARTVKAETAVQAIRFSGNDDLAAIEQRVADDFLAALANGDAQAVAALMDPVPFGNTDLRNGGSEARLAMAKALVAERDWEAALREARAVRVPEQANNWSVSGPGISGALTLRPLGDFIFVSAIVVGGQS